MPYFLPFRGRGDEPIRGDCMKALRQKGFYLWGKVINKALASTFHKNQSAAEIQHVGQVSYRDVWLEDNEKAIHIQLEY